MLFSFSQNRKKWLGQDLETAMRDGGLKYLYQKMQLGMHFLHARLLMQELSTFFDFRSIWKDKSKKFKWTLKRQSQHWNLNSS